MYAAMREGGNLAGFAIGKELLASFFLCFCQWHLPT